jgi:hypothetical protein
MDERRLDGRRAVTRAVGEPAMPGGLAEIVDLFGGESDRSRRFLGGLIAGALVGAALAGSAFLRRRSGRSAR